MTQDDEKVVFLKFTTPEAEKTAEEWDVLLDRLASTKDWSSRCVYVWKEKLLAELDDARSQGETIGREKENEACAKIAENEPEPEGVVPEEIAFIQPEELVMETARETSKSIADAIRRRL